MQTNEPLEVWAVGEERTGRVKSVWAAIAKLIDRSQGGAN